MSHLQRLVLTCLLLVQAPVASAQVPFDTAGIGERHVSVETRSSKAIAPGGVGAVVVVLDMVPGWHTHTNDPPELKGFYPVATELSGLKVEGATAGRIIWPSIHEIEVDFTGDGLEPYPVFEGRAEIVLPLKAAPDAGSQIIVEFELVFQACDDTTCDPPEFHPQRIVIPVREGADASLPGIDFASFQFGSPASPADELDRQAGSSFFGFTVPRGIIALAVFGAIGGLVLNLTPCVLPVIPLKVMALSKHAESPGRSLVLGVWMALGVVAFWVGIGLPVAFLTSVTDPSQIFGIWWVTLGIGVIILIMGVGIMGLFEIRLPDSVYAVNPKADTAAGSFLFGVMTAVLGLPCFGFVAGALLAGAATMPAAEIMTVFGAIGVGMASPYLVLAARPSWVEKLPRTGPASDLVKQVMGLLMIAAAVFFVGSGIMAYLKADPVRAAQLPIWAKVATWWAVAACATVAGVWLVWRTFRITPSAARRVTFALVGLVLAGAAVAFAAGRTNKAMHDIWSPFTQETLAGALAEGKVVVVDFTADWCLNCQALKATVLDRSPVKDRLASSGVVPLIADVTSRQAPGWDKLAELGQTGIPLLVVYGPGLSEPWMSNAYTAGQVIEALDAARGVEAKAGSD